MKSKPKTEKRKRKNRKAQAQGRENVMCHYANNETQERKRKRKAGKTACPPLFSTKNCQKNAAWGPLLFQSAFHSECLIQVIQGQF